MAATTSQIAISACKELITAATQHCSAAITAIPSAPPPVAQHPDWAAIDTGLTALSTAFVYGSLGLALLALAAALGWAYLVRGWAKDEAQRVAKETMNQWLDDEAPRIIREAMNLLKPDGGNPNTPAAEQEADEMGENAG